MIRRRRKYKRNFEEILMEIRRKCEINNRKLGKFEGKFIHGGFFEHLGH